MNTTLNIIMAVLWTVALAPLIFMACAAIYLGMKEGDE